MVKLGYNEQIFLAKLVILVYKLTAIQTKMASPKLLVKAVFLLNLSVKISIFFQNGGNNNLILPSFQKKRFWFLPICLYRKKICKANL